MFAGGHLEPQLAKKEHVICVASLMEIRKSSIVACSLQDMDLGKLPL